jgi:hypothetical protein
MITPSFSLTATERVLPRMALDFTTAVLDPRVTFTRSGNTATVINSSGLVAPINADLPRFDFDPTTLTCKGLLIEEASTNLLSYSEDFSNAVWNIKTNVGVAASATIDPAGGTNAFTLTANANGVVFGRTLTGTIGLPYTYAIWIRRKTGTGGVRMYVGDNVAQTITSQVSSAWNRISVSNTPTATTIRVYIQIDTSGDEIEVYGAQVEQKAFSTSYIPTEASQVTRNADVATMTGTNFSDWFNASEGAFFCEFTSFNANTRSVILLSDNSAANRMYFRYSSGGSLQFTSIISSVNEVTITPSGTSTINTVYQPCAAYKLNSYSYAINGTSRGTDDTANVPTLTQMSIGANFNSTAEFLCGHIRQFNYYPQRLTNAEVVAFSK